MKKVLFILLAACAAQLSTAQEKTLKDSPLDFSVDLKTSHLWRGLIISDKPMAAVFVKLKLNTSGSFSTGFWGGMAFSNESDGSSYKEINYYLQYAKNGLSIGLWNLFNTRGVGSPNIWNYRKETTGHILDLRTSYNFGQGFPLSLQANIFLRGSVDARNTNLNFEQRYSTYVQLAYPLIKESKVIVSGFVGAGFSLNGDTHLYGDGTQNFDLVNVGFTVSKIVKFGNLNVPFSSNILWNPSVKYARVQLIAHLF
jgi:hypothetical protein